jgi:ADP-ribosyl-[dinitrogen reductase] hydrolase
MKDKIIHAALFGLSVGDALGVPVEFKSRESLLASPIKTMTGYGTWQQPIGTWSDDSSLAFCLAESLTNGYDLQDIANKFVAWYQTGYWGAHHKVFDIGGATRFAIQRIMKGEDPHISGGTTEDDNGNGSLMRILPLLFYIKDLSIEERFKVIKEVSAITHGHFRSVFSCFIYLEFARNILLGNDKNVANTLMQHNVNQFIKNNSFNLAEIKLFHRLLSNNIGKVQEFGIGSSGYVLSTLEASIWCVLKTKSYADAVLKAVNLGSDTDTTACVTGGLAASLYGYQTIPESWINQLARKNDIVDLCNRLTLKYQ